ncbi:type I-B CRISPR-associated protein Cas8b/Csh1 [Sulfoacidibacillus thermotolerans]|uniref:Type I-B CRISPR-associated protein Cas8b/Csh1 n=1 Tax=Sulfoacidibacillus thermotolerans TaxID=1765684 RepID=A0A2U3D6V0_SULT2|nr:type I-B CRISPR-associated protein Cas8b/Csh1 [Sulfoacidibacillus thermotolerans]PWI57010.1 type I-B CRISPR-associated protein Cas8b/Csh1 [Sulfoacidibacillus thermotolerans]
MLEAMVQLGRLLGRKSGESDTEALVKPMPNLVGKGKRFVVEMNIDTVRGKLTFTPIECEPADKIRLAKELLWIGNADGAASLQWTATTQNLSYLLSQTIPNLFRILPENSEVRDWLNPVLHSLMVDLGPQKKGSEERYRHILDLSRLSNIPSAEWENLLDKTRDQSDHSIRAKELVPELEKMVLQREGYSLSQVYLFTLLLDGKRVVDHPDYRALVMRNKVEAVFEDAQAGRCSACGKSGTVTSNLTRMKFKYYNTDKMSFASGVDKKRFDRNLSLCSSCYTACLAAEPFVMGHMSSRIGHLRFYVIPEIFGPVSDELDPYRWNRRAWNQVQSALNFKEIAELEDELALEQSVYEQGYVVNLLFHVWNNAELRLFNLVRDVPKTRFETIQEGFQRADRIAKLMLGPRSNNEQWNWRPDFNTIYHLIPVSRSNKTQEYRRVLQVFDAILTGQPVSYKLLMQSFAKLIEIRRFGRYDATNVEEPKAGYELARLTDDVLMANIVLFSLQDLGQLATDSPMKRRDGHLDTNHDVVNEKVNPEMFLETVGYKASHEALFWLGAAIASVATAQQKNGLDTMPVLEKINYRGMNAGDVVRLVGKIEDAFRQYKLFGSGADTLFRMHTAFAAALDTAASPLRWKKEYSMTDEEAVFYILSGFAVKRKEILSHRRKDTTKVGLDQDTQNNDLQNTQ